MLTNVTRAQTITRVDEKIGRLGRVSAMSLIATIDEAGRQAAAPVKLLAQCFELANFCAVYPNHEDVKRIAATVSLACDTAVPLDERIFIVNKLFRTTLDWDRTPMRRLPLTGLAKEQAEAIYQGFIQIQQKPADARRIGEELLAKAHTGETSLPGYFLRDLKTTLHASAMAKAGEATSEESNQGWAALQYLAKDKDAIPDTYGYLGLVDDMHVMRLAAKKILPQLDSLEIITDEVFQRLPFLHELRFNRRGQYGHHISEYLTISCLPLFDKVLGEERSIANISLVEEPTLHSISASLIIAFALLHNFVARHPGRLRYEELTDPDALEVGQEVTRRDDGTRWIFQGVTTLEEGGEEFISLEAVGRSAGVSSLVRRSTPLVARQGRARERIGGTFKLNAAELLFDLEKFDYNQYEGQERIFLVCNRNRYEAELEKVLINDIPWRKAIPIGVIPSSRGTEFTDEIEVLSGGKPSSVVLYLVPNIRTLIDYHYSAEVELINDKSIVIVDGSSETTSLDRLDELRGLGASVNLFVSSVTHANNISQLLEQGFTSFRWDSQILGAYQPIGPKGSGFQNWENSLGKSLHQNVISHLVPSTDADTIYQSMQRIERYLKLNSAEIYQHSQKLLEDSKDITLALLRLNINCVADRKELGARMLALTQLREIVDSSRLISEEQAAILLSHLDIVAKHLEPALEIKARYFTQVANDLNKPKRFSANGSLAIGGSFLPLESAQIKQRDECVLAYWPGQKRVARLVNAKSQTFFYVILFQHELSWLRAFRRNYYAIPTPNSVYPRLRVASEIIPDTGTAEFDDAEAKHLSNLRRAALEGVQETDDRLAKATRLIYADGNNVIFASARSQFSVVVTSSGTSKLVERPGAQIQAGDQLAYLPDAERGAIRETADRMFLEQGTRDLATSWRTALQKFFEKSGFTLETLQKLLASVGVDRGLDTLAQWVEDEDRIYPTGAKDVIPKIFSVIGEPKTSLEVESILDAINSVISAHFRASEYLEKLIVAGLNEGENANVNLRVLEVIAVEDCDHQVPYRLLSQPKSIDTI